MSINVFPLSCDGGFSGQLNIPLWSDVSGSLAAQFDLFDEENNQILDGIVVIDDEGVVRHAMTTSLECSDTADNCLELVKILKVYNDKEKKKSPVKKTPTAPTRSDKVIFFETIQEF